jgi:hypothetical protein
LQAPTHAEEQQVLQQLFQLRDLLADGTLGQVQFFGGAGETQVPGHGLETLHAVIEGKWRLFSMADPFSCLLCPA